MNCNTGIFEMAKYNLIAIELRFCETSYLPSLFIGIVRVYHHTIVLLSYRNQNT